MAALKNGSKAPDFTLPADGGASVTLSQLKGQPVVLYFYPKDDTPGCTQESCDFRDNLTAFKRMKVQVLGISKDSIKKHDKFKEKYELNFPLLSDEEGDVCEKYGVWVEKTMYGKKRMGIKRSTFVIDAEGNVARAMYGVKPEGHADEVLEALPA